MLTVQCQVEQWRSVPAIDHKYPLARGGPSVELAVIAGAASVYQGKPESLSV